MVVYGQSLPMGSDAYSGQGRGAANCGHGPDCGLSGAAQRMGKGPAGGQSWRGAPRRSSLFSPELCRGCSDTFWQAHISCAMTAAL